MRWAASLHALLLAAATSTVADASTDRADQATFRESDLLSGVTLSEAQCGSRPGFVWVRSAGEAACLRYWVSGLQTAKSRHAMVYLTGDAISNGRAQPAYLTRSPASMERFVVDVSRELGVPFLLLARPGTYGSSGDHRERRRAAEARLVSAALDQLRTRLGIERYSVVGFSGGGHVAVSLVAWRTDLTCVVLASSVSSPRKRWGMKGMTRDITGYEDSVEPVELLNERREGLRVLIVGDPADTNTPWQTQRPIGERLKALGAEVAEVMSEGEGPERHDVSRHARAVGRDCMAR
jgi:predicted esterase